MVYFNSLSQSIDYEILQFTYIQIRIGDCVAYCWLSIKFDIKSFLTTYINIIILFSGLPLSMSVLHRLD